MIRLDKGVCRLFPVSKNKCVVVRARDCLCGGLLTSTAHRIAPFTRALLGAAGSEPAAAAMLVEINRQRLTGISVMAQHAAATGQLAVSEDECRDVVWATTDGTLWRQLVVEQGWSDDRFATWLGRMWVALLTQVDAASTTPGTT